MLEHPSGIIVGILLIFLSLVLFIEIVDPSSWFAPWPVKMLGAAIPALLGGWVLKSHWPLRSGE